MSSARGGATSVIIPVGRVDGALDHQVAAVLNQACSCPFELILALNDPNPVNADALAARWPVRSGRSVRVVNALDRPGAAYARNVGARLAAGERLAFCDADDLVHPGWLAGLLVALEEHDAVSGAVVDVFADARSASWHPPTTAGDLPRFLGRPYLLSGNLGVRRAAFTAVGGFDESLTRCEDIAFGWALTRAGLSIGYAPDAVISYHHRAGLLPMLRRHYMYGRGMSETLLRYGAPIGDEQAPGRRARLLRPNGQAVQKVTLGGTARRGAIALGRVRGLIGTRVVAATRDGTVLR